MAAPDAPEYCVVSIDLHLPQPANYESSTPWRKEQDGAGTGFFWHDLASTKYFLITCKHVIIDWKSDYTPEVRNSLRDTEVFVCRLRNNGKLSWKPSDAIIFHPTEDLAALPVAALPATYVALDSRFIFAPVGYVPSMKTVHMYSLPYITSEGLLCNVPCFDDSVRIPIIRTGHLAYPFAMDFKGEKIGLTSLNADCGDSGAPLIVDHMPLSVPESARNGQQQRLYLLGIHCAGHFVATKQFIENEANIAKPAAQPATKPAAKSAAKPAAKPAAAKPTAAKPATAKPAAAKPAAAKPATAKPATAKLAAAKLAAAKPAAAKPAAAKPAANPTAPNNGGEKEWSVTMMHNIGIGAYVKASCLSKMEDWCSDDSL